MGLFDINYFSKVTELNPPDKRFSINVAWMRSLIKPIQYLRDKILGDYRLGSSYPQWIAGTYAKNAVVIYKQVAYESLEDGNTDTPPSAKWVQYLPSFIGVDTRVKFNGQKLVLEYAMNQYYFTSFRQPPLVSDIYITNSLPSVVGFIVGATEAYSSTSAQSDTAGISDWSIGSYAQYAIVRNTYNGNLRMYVSKVNSNTDEPPSSNWLQVDTVGYASTFQLINNFTIHVPSSVYYSSLPFAPTIESDLRQFVDKIIPAGLNYIIVSY